MADEPAYNWYWDISRKLDTILTVLQSIVGKEKVMSVQLDTLTAQVQKNTDTEASAVLLIQGLAGQIAALKTDPVALQALADDLNTSAKALASAVTANTPPPASKKS